MDNEQSPNSDQDIQGLISQMQPDSASRFSSGTQAAAPSGKEPAAGEDSDVTALMGNMTPESRSTFGGAPSPRASISGPIVQSKTTPIKTTPKLFHTAGTPAPSDKPELTLGQSLQQAGHNFFPDAMATGKSMVGAVTNPSETWNAIKGIGTGLGSQLYGALGGQQDPEEKESNEQAAKALEDHFAQYGSWKGFKENLATHPVGTAMDLSLPISGGVGALTRAGLLTGDAAEIAATAARLSNPVNAALSVAKNVVSNPVTRAFQAGATNVPMSLLKAAKVVGESTNPEVRTAFTTFANGQGDPNEFLGAAQNTLGDIRAKISADYLKGKGSLANSPVDLNNVLNKIQELRATKLQSAGANVPQFVQANKVLDDLEQRVLSYQAAGKTNLQDVDILKQSIWDDGYGLPKGSEAQNTVGSIYNATKDAISAVDPDYSNLMESYQGGLSKLKDIQTNLGVGKNATATAAIAKMLRATKTSAGSNLLSELTSKNPKLTAMLAGAAINPWIRPGMIGQIEGYGVPVLAMTNPSYLPHLAGVALASSPRVAGKLNYAAGRIPQALKDVTYPAYLASQAREENAPSGDMSGGPSNASQSAGGPSNTQQGDQSLPRNVINHNPGNITDSDFAKRQPGYVGSDGQFAVFDKPENGYSAQKTLLSSYGSEGTDTIDAIINKWSPSNASGNTPESTEHYKSEVAKRLGIGIHDHLNMSDPNVLDALSKAMANFEGDKRSATGGRIGRASGGRIMNHKSEADNLIRLADKTKKSLNNSTESLLAVPDEAVTKALSIANEAI